MCPMRIILIFFSALLAAYVAWRTARSSQEEGEEAAFWLSEDSTTTKIPSSPADGRKEFSHCVSQMMQNGFWTFIDMASGRYLWRNVKEITKAKTI